MNLKVHFFLVISHNRSFLKKLQIKFFGSIDRKIRISPKGFANFNEWSNSLIEQEKREIDNKKGNSQRDRVVVKRCYCKKKKKC